MRFQRSVFLLVVVAASWLGLPVPAVAKSAPRVVMNDTFGGFDDAVWSARFDAFDRDEWSWRPGTGSVTVDRGAITLRPDAYQSCSFLQTRASLVTSLPARITYRIRFRGDELRQAEVHVSGNHIGEGAGWSGESGIRQVLGQTHYTVCQPELSAVDPDGTRHSVVASRDPAVIPVDRWLYGDVWLSRDSVRTSFNGIVLKTPADVDAIVGTAGLRVTIATTADYSQRGFDLDVVRVVQAAELDDGGNANGRRKAMVRQGDRPAKALRSGPTRERGCSHRPLPLHSLPTTTYPVGCPRRAGE